MVHYLSPPPLFAETVSCWLKFPCVSVIKAKMALKKAEALICLP